MDPEEARRVDDDPARDARWEPYFERSIDAVIAVSRELTRRARARIGVFAAGHSRMTSLPSSAIQPGGTTARNGSAATSTSRSSRRSSRTSLGSASHKEIED